jgi:hypothetical protein
MRLRPIGTNLLAAAWGSSSQPSGAAGDRGGFAGVERDLGQLRVRG